MPGEEGTHSVGQGKRAGSVWTKVGGQAVWASRGG